MGLRKSLVEVGEEGNGFKDREVVVGFAHNSQRMDQPVWLHSLKVYQTMLNCVHSFWQLTYTSPVHP